MDSNKLQKFQEIIDESNNIVFFGGAGVSTESGIPDFRSTSGLYHQEWKYPPETIVSSTFFWNKTSEFYRFYCQKMIALDAKPNACHLKLAELEKVGKLSAIVTQNIDGLHQKAGSKNVLELIPIQINIATIIINKIKWIQTTHCVLFLKNLPVLSVQSVLKS